MSQPRSRDRFSIDDIPDPLQADNVRYNPTHDELRRLARPDEQQTEFGSPAYISRERSRSADRTSNSIDSDFSQADYEYLQTAIDIVHEREMISLDRRVGRHPELSFVCRYFVPVEYARIAHAWGSLLDPVDEPVEPDFQSIQIPDYDDIAIRILPDAGYTAILGSDYTGEAKKSFLRMFMFEAKQQNGLGLHAGSKSVAIDRGGEIETVGQLFLGLSATGKSTLTCHDYHLESPEDAQMLQDDVCALLPDGTVPGSEGTGLYIKTHGLTPEEQPGLYAAATSARAIFENIDVSSDGSVDMDSTHYTANGRAVIQRDDLPIASADIDLESVDQVFFITRNPVMPPIAKLTPAEGAAAFMLGESVQTSAGDPDKAGEAVRVVGTNPFIIGSRAKEGNRFLELVESLDIECYIINTGSVGDRNIGVDDTITIIREVARGAVEWTNDEDTDMRTPASIPGLDIEQFSIVSHVDEYDRRLEVLRQSRRQYLEEFAGLDPRIKRAIY